MTVILQASFVEIIDKEELGLGLDRPRHVDFGVPGQQLIEPGCSRAGCAADDEARRFHSAFRTTDRMDAAEVMNAARCINGASRNFSGNRNPQSARYTKDFTRVLFKLSTVDKTSIRCSSRTLTGPVGLVRNTVCQPSKSTSCPRCVNRW